MPTHIHKLNCHVTVRRSRKGAPLDQTQAPPRPSMAFALPHAALHSELAPEAAQTASQEPREADEHGEERDNVTPGEVDVRAVADRVYELMRDEIALDRLRGGARRQR